MAPLSFTILTLTAEDSLGHHDRAPVIVLRNMIANLRDPKYNKPDNVKQLLGAFPEPVLRPRLVSDRGNSVRKQRRLLAGWDPTPGPDPPEPSRKRGSTPAGPAAGLLFLVEQTGAQPELVQFRGRRGS